MPGRLQDKAALITGAGSGIGLESSILFAQEGANVLLVDVNLPAAEKVQKLIADRFPNVKSAAFKADVGKEEDVKAAVDKAVELFGRLDVMFNNAGIMHPADDNALNTEEKIWDLTHTINVKGVWWGCKYAILAMRNNPVDEAKGLHTVEVAKGALFLASDDSSYMTGTDFKVDGGLTSAYVTPIGEPALPPPSSLV
ncbi:unnamed protein product [Somion occarium]|uniref:Uncharacterized protein n=1 Tax=Somion occarium TaxID=3059160 RepID=A0ABP1D3X2_9APHY